MKLTQQMIDLNYNGIAMWFRENIRKVGWGKTKQIFIESIRYEFGSMWFHINRIVLNTLGLSELVGYDGDTLDNLNSVRYCRNLSDVETKLRTSIHQEISRRAENGFSTVFFDIDQLTWTPSVTIIPDVVKARTVEFGAAMSIFHAKDDIDVVKSTYYGIKILWNSEDKSWYTNNPLSLLESAPIDRTAGIGVEFDLNDRMRRLIPGIFSLIESGLSSDCRLLFTSGLIDLDWCIQKLQGSAERLVLPIIGEVPDFDRFELFEFLADLLSDHYYFPRRSDIILQLNNIETIVESIIEWSLMEGADNYDKFLNQTLTILEQCDDSRTGDYVCTIMDGFDLHEEFPLIAVQTVMRAAELAQKYVTPKTVKLMKKVLGDFESQQPFADHEISIIENAIDNIKNA